MLRPGGGARRLALALAATGLLACTSSAAAGVSFRGDLEGSGLSGWPRVQAEPDRPLSDSFERVTSPVRQGKYAAKIMVRHGYSQFGWNEDTELAWHSTERQGEEYYYAFSTLFPADWRAPHHWGIFAQWHATLGTSPAVSFNARNDTADLNVLAGRTDEKANTFDSQRKFRLLTTLSKGSWNDFVLRVRWSGRDNGVVEVWHRVAGRGGFSKKVSLAGIPTLQWAPARGQSADKPASIYILWGLYRGSYCTTPTQLNCSSPLGVQPTSVLYQDGFVRGSSFDEVVGAAFGGGSGTTTAEPPTRPAKPKPNPRKKRITRVTRGALKLQQLKRLRTVVDSGCGGCRVFGRGAEVRSRVAGGVDDRDTAYRLMRVGGRLGLSGQVSSRVSIRLARGQKLIRNLAVFQVRDTRDELLYELYVAGGDRTLRLWSPPGGLRSTVVILSTGVVVPNDGVSRLAVETVVRPNRSVVVRVGGVARTRVTGLTGGSTRAARILRVGIDHYDTSSQSEPVTVFHSRLAVRGRK